MHRFVILLAATLSAGFAQPVPQPLEPVRLLPNELVWRTAPGCVEQAVTGRDGTGPGLYAMRMRFARDCRAQPHQHPNDRIVVVLSGTMYFFGFGTTFDRTASDAAGKHLDGAGESAALRVGEGARGDPAGRRTWAECRKACGTMSGWASS